jgi:AraC-like DNA-binding protein/mannose-6-phosphate isomerase-like protein (cupin superfamily)
MSTISQSDNQHDAANDTDAERPVLAVAHDRPKGFRIPAHSHFRAQLMYSADGVMRVETASGAWVVPPQQAVWLPAEVEHSMTNAGPIALRTLYLHPRVSRELPTSCCVISVPPVLRELILYVAALSQHYEPGSLTAKLMSAIPDLLQTLEPEPLHLPLPVDRRLGAITDALMQDPCNNQPLAFWAEHSGASERTLLRHFRNETGMSFNEWRQRLRLLWAITLLSEGQSVTAVSYELGYSSPSAFIAMFQRNLGCSPKNFVRGSRAHA